MVQVVVNIVFLLQLFLLQVVLHVVGVCVRVVVADHLVHEEHDGLAQNGEESCEGLAPDVGSLEGLGGFGHHVHECD